MQFSQPDYVVVIVEDLERALSFYVGTLGLPLVHRSGAFAQLATGATRVALYERRAMSETLGQPISAPDPLAPGFELGFKVPNVDAAFDELVRGGAVPAMPPTDRAWGQRTAYVRDPDGHLIELAEDRRRPGAAP
jgi:lactoylglutathione lyase